MRRWISFILIFTMMTTFCSDTLAATVALPKSLKKIADSAFYRDNALNEVYVPYGAESIDELAFAYSGIKRIMIPNTVTYIAENAFLGVEDLVVVAPGGSSAQIYAEAESQANRGFVWENADSLYDREQALDFLNIMASIDIDDDISLKELDYSQIPVDDNDSAENEDIIKLFNNGQAELEAGQAEYETALDELSATLEPLIEVLSPIAFSQTENAFEIQTNTSSFSVSGDGLESLDEGFEVVSTWSDENGVLIAEINSNGEQLWAKSDGSSLIVTKREAGASRSEESLNFTAQRECDISPRGVIDDIFSGMQGLLTQINTYLSPLTGAVDNWVAILEGRLLKAERQVDLARQAYQQGKILTIVSAELNRDTIRKTLSTAKAIQKSLLKIAVGVVAAGVSIATDVSCISTLGRIEGHGHPTAEEQLSPEKLKVATLLQDEITAARRGYITDAFLCAFDIVSEVTHTASFIALMVPHPGAKAAAYGANAVLKLSIKVIEQLVIRFCGSLVASAIANAHYERVLNTDEYLHCAVAGIVTGIISKEPIAGVKVLCIEDGLEALTKDDGTFILSVTPGTKSIRFEKEHYSPAAYKVIAKKNETTRLNAAILENSSISGTVKDQENGKPVSGARINVANLYKCETEEDGTFSMDCGVGTFGFSCTADGYKECETKKVTIPIDEPLVMDIRLQPKIGTLSGTVTDTETPPNPLSGVLITCGDESATTAADGTYSMELREGNYTVVFSKEGYDSEATLSVTIREDQTTDGSKALNQVGVGTVSGKVTDVNGGAALSGVSVVCGEQSDVTKDDGTYSLEGVPIGNRTVTFSLSGYKEEELPCTVQENKTTTLYAKLKKNDNFEIVTFGQYPQGANGEIAPIEWYVLSKSNGYALLLSRYCLDGKPYNTVYEDVTWATCTLRAWLNGTFMNTAFTDAEQGAIRTTLVDNSRSQGHAAIPGFTDDFTVNTTGGNNTNDKVFLLSLAEAYRYLGGKYGKVGGVTDWYVDNGKTKTTAYADINYCKSRWWLRSPGVNFQNSAAYVGSAGQLDSWPVDDGHYGVRPALWVNLDSDIF